MTIRETSGSTQTSRPISFGRVFKQGDITDYPKPRINGIAATLWQADVRNRWDDGSVKYAVVSFHTDLAASATVAVDFIESADACHLGDLATCQAAAMDGTAMLAMRSGAWTATIEITNGSTLTANARTMIGAGHYTYWLRGPVVTQMVVQELTSRTYEMGFTLVSGSPVLGLHPMFIITGYPNYTAGLRQEFILENGWTDRFCDQTYSLAIKNGASGATTVYSRASFTHYASARWHKGNEGAQIWDGTAPGAIEFNFNWRYLVEAKALPYFDAERFSVGASTVSSLLATYNSSDKGDEFGENGFISSSFSLVQKGFGATGGRPELGWIHEYQLMALAAGASSLDPMLYNIGDIAGHVPLHMREARTDNLFCSYACTSGPNASLLAYSKPLHIEARRTFYSAQGTSNWAAAPTAIDRVLNVSTVTYGGWGYDNAHSSSLAYLPYILSGSFYYYEEVMYWSQMLPMLASVDSANYGRNYEWGLGNPSSSSNMRAAGWTFRHVSQRAFIALDDSAEKTAALKAMDWTVEMWEGITNVTAGNFPPATSTSCPGHTAGAASGPGSGANRNPWCFGRYIIDGNRSNPANFPPAFTNGAAFCNGTTSGIMLWGPFDCAAVNANANWATTWQFAIWLTAVNWANDAVRNKWEYVFEKYGSFYIELAKNHHRTAATVLGGAYSYYVPGRTPGNVYFSTLSDYHAAMSVSGSTTLTAAITSGSSTTLTVADWTKITFKPGWKRTAAAGQITAIDVSSGTIRLTFSTPHYLAVGDQIMTQLHATTALNTHNSGGVQTAARLITAVPSSTQLEYTYTGASAPSDGSYAVGTTMVAQPLNSEIWVRVGSEVLKVCRLDTTTGVMTIGTTTDARTMAASGCTASGGSSARGQVGTTATAHSIGETVEMAYDAMPHYAIGEFSYNWSLRGAMAAFYGVTSATSDGTELWTWLDTYMVTPYYTYFLATENPSWSIEPRNRPRFRITTTGIPSGTEGASYSTTLQATGNTGAVSWTSTTLPAGITLASSTGVLSGIPSGAIATNVTFTATDAATSATRSVTLGFGVVEGSVDIVVSPSSLPTATVLSNYSLTISATGGTAPYTCSVISSSLPTGMTLSSACLLSGNPTVGGEYSFVIRVTDALGNIKDKPYNFTINWLLISITTTTQLPSGIISLPYSKHIDAIGGSGVYTCSVVDGTLGGGLTLNGSTCTITGTPDTVETYVFRIAVNSSDGQATSREFTLDIPPPTLFPMVLRLIIR